MLSDFSKILVLPWNTDVHLSSEILQYSTKIAAYHLTALCFINRACNFFKISFLIVVQKVSMSVCLFWQGNECLRTRLEIGICKRVYLWDVCDICVKLARAHSDGTRHIYLTHMLPQFSLINLTETYIKFTEFDRILDKIMTREDMNVNVSLQKLT